MKIAILMHGLAGKTDKYGTGNNIDISISHQHLVRHILDKNPNCEIDFFMHSWSIEQEQQIKDLYSPKHSIFEPQIIFDFNYSVGDLNGPGGESNKWVDGKFKGVENLRFHSLFSKWYSAKVANDLKKRYEIENGFSYDFVMLTRYDLAYKVDFDFKKFEDNKFYAIPPLSHHGIQDLWFISNTNDMNLFCLMFDWIKNINHFPHKFTHSHWLAEQFLRKTKLIERLAFFGPERPWDLGKEGVKNGSAPLVRDFYEISELTLDEDMGRVREEIKNNARRVIK